MIKFKIGDKVLVKLNPGRAKIEGTVIGESVTLVKNTGIKIKYLVKYNEVVDLGYVFGGFVMNSKTKYFTEEELLNMGNKSLYIDNNILIDCDHSWKEYVGLSKSYNYCEKCDLKVNK